METYYVREVSLRYRGRGKKAPSAITEPKKAADFIRKILPDNVREHFVALYLCGSRSVIGYSVVSTGTANSCPACPREIFQPAVHIGACSILVAHNHPSGSLLLSREDCDVTAKLKEAGALLSIPLLDHVIVTDSGEYSFHESGRL
jgi:DNA repair protein RadC